MNTIPEQLIDGRRRRRTHSDQFKADVVAACMQPGISMAAVAMSRRVNANPLRRWMRDAEMKPPANVPSVNMASAPAPPTPAFVPLTQSAAAAPQDIRIELWHGAMSASARTAADASGQPYWRVVATSLAATTHRSLRAQPIVKTGSPDAYGGVFRSSFL